MNEEKRNSFEILNDINLTDKIKEKIGLKYLSWADAWAVLKANFPDASMKVYTRTVKTTVTNVVTQDGSETTTVTTSEDELPYFTDGKTCYVKVGVTINDVEYVELLPVMDNRNNAVNIAVVTMTLVNKAIQRAFVKACARHGLGLYIYAGEDLPEVDRKVIDFKKIADKTDKMQTVALSDEGFASLLKDTIALVQAEYPSDASQAIVDYTVKQSKGKKLSLFSNADDAASLQRINNFINSVKQELAAPASGK